VNRTFGPRRDEVTGQWRRLHNEELNDLSSSPNIVRVIKSRRVKWVGHVARVGEEGVVYRVLLGKPEGRRPRGRPRPRWVENIRMDLQEVRRMGEARGCIGSCWGNRRERDHWGDLGLDGWNILGWISRR